MKFSIYQDSRKGGRRNNQDRTGYDYTREALFMVVADGMGGHLHGEVAAQITVRSLSEGFRREARPRLADPFLFLLQSITNAHHAILDFAEASGLLETPRTTCVACVVQDAVAYWAHAGDSRLYHVRHGKVCAQTKDHSRVQMLMDQGRIREEAAAAHPDRNKILNCLGSMLPPRVELSRRTVLQPGDTLLLCTDGLWGPLSGPAIGAALARDDIMCAMPALLDEAESRGGRDCDNLSVVAMTWAEACAGGADHVSTATLGAETFTIDMEPCGKTGDSSADVSNRELEQTAAEIRNAIRRQSAK